MRDSSNFYALVSGLLGKKLKDGEKFNPLSLLGGPCMVNVSNSQKGDKTYHNISAVTQFPDGFPPPKAIHQPLSWSIMQGQPFPTGTEWFPYIYGKSIKQMADTSAEAKRRANQIVPPLTSPGSGPGDSIPF